MAYVVYVVGGLVAILIGAWRGRKWIRNPWFRVTHLLAILIVVIEIFLKLNCPLDHLGEPSASGGAAAGRWQRLHGSIVDLHLDWGSPEVGYQWRVFCLCDRDCGYVLLGAAEVEKRGKRISRG